jgi:PIN domain nuclease of toxin-antitoxin system
VRYLLDTHIALAIANEASRELPKGVRDLLADSAHAFVVSVASLWEIAIKTRLRRLSLHTQLEALPAQLAIVGIEFIDIRLFHSLTQVEPVPPTNDPFDRMLLAVAQIEQCQLITLDRALRNHPLAWRPASP